MNDLTIEDTLDLLEQVVADAGPDHFTHCSYLDVERQPNCIAARVFSYAGAQVDEIARLRSMSVRDAYKREVLPVPMTLGASEVLYAAQKAQDGFQEDAEGNADRTWGNALLAAHKAADRYLTLFTDA